MSDAISHTANYHIRDAAEFHAATYGQAVALQIGTPGAAGGELTLFLQNKEQILALAAAVGQMLAIAEKAWGVAA